MNKSAHDSEITAQCVSFLDFSSFFNKTICKEKFRDVGCKNNDFIKN
jgi:hypothetical protein